METALRLIPKFLVGLVTRSGDALRPICDIADFEEGAAICEFVSPGDRFHVNILGGAFRRRGIYGMKGFDVSRVGKIFRSVVFLGWLSFALASLTIGAGVWAFQATLQVAELTTDAAAAAIRHRKALTEAASVPASYLARQSKAHLNQVARLTSQHSAALAALTVAHRKQLFKAVLKTKAKARLRRFVLVIPLAGAAAALAFEEMDYREWRKDHPDGTRGQYGCELYTVSVEVLDDFARDVEVAMAGAPAWVPRPSRETIAGWLPECGEKMEE